MTESSKKVAGRTVAAERCREWHSRGLRVVFTNGVFDLLHRGHVEYLTEAGALGDRLVVGVNDDESARRLGKGPDRPLNRLQDRLVVLAGLEVVDLLVPFEEDTPLELIKLLEPDVLVKGGDYAVEEVVGAEEVCAGGGELVLIPLREEHSTTLLIERIRGSLP